MKERKKPLRKCTACNQMKEKKELVRIVRSKEGEYSIDHIGKKPGRGAYICPSLDCLEKAYKHKSLERSFKEQVPAEIYESLKEELTELYG